MNDLTPRQPSRPLFWPDIVLGLQEAFRSTKHPIYLIGGAVRDAMLHYPLHDIDLTTSGDSLRLARQIANHFQGDYFVLDAERGVGRALLNTSDGRMMVDVARFRSTTLLDDLKDRDFTINAMAVDLKGDLNLLIDPLDGETDLVDKHIRRCSPNALQTDPVRALRAVRQSIQFTMRIEPETMRDVKNVASELRNVSPERVRDEFFKLLSLPRPSAGARVTDRLGLLQVIVPETITLHQLQPLIPDGLDGWERTLAIMEYLTKIVATISYARTDNTAASFGLGMMAIQLDRYRKQLLQHLNTVWPNDRTHRALLMFAALMHEIGQSQSNYKDIAADNTANLSALRADALRLSNAERQRLTLVIQNYTFPLGDEQLTPLVIHRFWRRTGEAGLDVCFLALAHYLGIYGAELKQDPWLVIVERVRLLLEAFYEKRDTLISPPVLVDGNQLVSTLGLKPGPIIGQLLDKIREAQVEGQVHSQQDALDLVRTFINKEG